MRKLFVLILGLAMANAPVFAGETEGDVNQDRRGGDRLARMQAHLGLSDEQVQQIREIRANGGGRAEIQGVLTEGQVAIMQERRSQTHGRGGKGRNRGAGGQNGEGQEPGNPDEN